MSRTVRMTVPPSQRATLMERLQRMEGIVSIFLHPGAAQRPEGDLLVLHGTNQAAETAARIGLELGLADEGCISIGEPVALVSARHRREIIGDTDEANWEEMDTLLRRDANLTHNFLAMMAASGALAAMGLVMDQVLLVIAGMLITPAFTPLVRITMGLLSGLIDTAWHGLKAMLSGYAALALGAAVGAVLAGWADPDLDLTGIAERHWVTYWSKVTWTGAVTALLAGFAGSVIVNAHQTVFASGVMMALALVPATAIVGIGMAAGEGGLALSGLARCTADMACVLASSALVFALKRVIVRRRGHP